MVHQQASHASSFMSILSIATRRTPTSGKHSQTYLFRTDRTCARNSRGVNSDFTSPFLCSNQSPAKRAPKHSPTWPVSRTPSHKSTHPFWMRICFFVEDTSAQELAAHAVLRATTTDQWTCMAHLMCCMRTPQGFGSHG